MVGGEQLAALWAFALRSPRTMNGMTQSLIWRFQPELTKGSISKTPNQALQQTGNIMPSQMFHWQRGTAQALCAKEFR